MDDHCSPGPRSPMSSFASWLDQLLATGGSLMGGPPVGPARRRAATWRLAATPGCSCSTPSDWSGRRSPVGCRRTARRASASNWCTGSAACRCPPPRKRNPPVSDVPARLRRHIVEPLKARFVGRDEVIDLTAVAVVAGEHLFLYGPPGTAKSALVRQFASAVHGRYFEYLLTRFSEPNEVFGPVDPGNLREA